MLNALEALDLQDYTLVVFLSDHGDMKGDHGLIWKGIYIFKSCVDILTIIKAPDCRKGVVSEVLMSQVDLIVSVLKLCGITILGSDWVKIKTPFERGSMLPLHIYPGRSYEDILEGSIIRIRENVVNENDDPSTGFQARCLITDEYRITVYPGTVQGELFDLKNDPDEQYNRWHDVKYADLKCRLIAALLNSYSRHTPYYPVPYWNS